MADHPPAAAGRSAADVRRRPKRQPQVDPAAIQRTRNRIAARLFDRELAEKVAIVALVSVIFVQMLGVDAGRCRSPSGWAW